MFDKQRLQDVLVAYKKDFALTWWENEKYKWEAIKTFQDNWKIDANDFADMLERSLSGTKNLLASVHYFPRAMIKELADKAPEEVRSMFNDLYNEKADVVDRILEFKKKSDELLANHGAGSQNHFQDERAISNYLWLRYPDKYYIYKLSELQSASKFLHTDYKLKKGKHADNLRCFYSLYDEVCEEIQKDEELKQLLKEHLTDECYPDPQYRTLTLDICYYIATKQPLPNNPQIWKISHGTDATGIEKSLRDKFAERKVVVVNGATKAVATTKVSQGDYFKTHIKGGDFFYLCYGNSIQLLGQFVGDDAVLNQEMPDNWYERKYKVIVLSKNTSAYDGEKKWWSPNYNSTCVPVNNEEQGLFEKLILKPYFDMTIDELPNRQLGQGYWWLNADPKIWSYSGLAIDEIVAYTLYNENGNKRRIFQNFLDARAGDMVIGYEATPVKQIVAICQIEEEQDGKEIKFKKKVNLTTPIDYAQLKACPELSKFDFFLNPNGSLFSLRKEEFDFIMDQISKVNPIPNPNIEKYTKQDFLSEVFMHERKYDELVAVLRNKKNIILQGAPGVGKTFAAKRLAHSMMGEQDDSRIEFVQFHQNYSYEDFMMGYKPSENGFEMKKGVFHKFCIKALNQPDKDFFFIIDEINRGNMSKIFGELLMMIENDYRGVAVTLAYDEIPFAVPKNLYLIGMMNTADRSLAMIDYALRRRFSFIEMMPAFDTKGFKDYQNGFGNTLFNQLIEKVKELNETITSDNSLGKGFCIGHSYFSNWKKEECTREKMLSVVNYDIIPMLEEYWFDDNNKVAQWSDELRKVLE